MARCFVLGVVFSPVKISTISLSVITFLSDFGPDSFLTASLRGSLHKLGIELPFLEISSSIEAFDIVEASYLSSMVFQDFPFNSIHILATNVVATSVKGHLAASYKGHLFIAPDNGVLPLIFEGSEAEYYLIPTETFEQKIEKLYAPFIQKLINANFSLDQIASKADKINTKSKLVPVKDEKELRGTILFVDHFGNAYSNIHRSDFESFVEGRTFQLNLSRHERIQHVSNNFADVLDGDALCFFSDHDYMVVAIKKGNAEQLLNLRKYKPLIVERL